MRIPMRFCLFLFCLLPGIFSAQTFAGVGQTSAGVTTTTGNQNDPSAEVQQQSSGFVQQNQQLANAPTPGAATSASGAAAAQNGQAGAAGVTQNGNKANAAIVNGAPAAVSVPAPVAAPPPPPPNYESTMRRLDRRTDTPPTPTVIASGPPDAVRKPDSTQPPKPPQPKLAPAPAVSASVSAVAAGRTENATAQAASEHVVPPAVSGGRGEAPDGFTFYSGISIAGALFAFAFATFLRMGRNDGT